MENPFKSFARIRGAAQACCKVLAGGTVKSYNNFKEKAAGETIRAKAPGYVALRPE